MRSRGHCVKAASIASCTASSAAEKSRKRRATTPSTCGASSRSRCSEVVSHGLVISAHATAFQAGAHSSPVALQSACLAVLRRARAQRKLWLQSHTHAPGCLHPRSRNRQETPWIRGTRRRSWEYHSCPLSPAWL